MNIEDYIRDNRKGAEANRLEKESLKDPFLYDAIDGFDSIEDNHMARIEELRAKISIPSQHNTKKINKFRFIPQIAVASVVIIACLAGYFLLNDNYKSEIYAHKDSQHSALINVYVPESFYEKNEILIEEKNDLLIQSSEIINENVQISTENASLQKDDSVETDNDTIYIYIPNA